MLPLVLPAPGIMLTCHQLRHTFARRLVEHGLPVDSLAKLLGHSQLHTTQRYIDGANPTVRTDFAAAIAQLDTVFIRDRAWPSDPPPPSPLAQPRTASPAELPKLRERLADLPPWMAESAVLGEQSSQPSTAFLDLAMPAPSREQLGDLPSYRPRSLARDPSAR